MQSSCVMSAEMIIKKEKFIITLFCGLISSKIHYQIPSLARLKYTPLIHF